MSVSFAGHFLPTFDRAMELRIEAAIAPSEVYEFAYPTFPGKGRDHLPWPMQTPLPPIQLGRLRWPTGASRWASAHFLIGDADLNQLNPLLHAGLKLPLTLSDGTRTVTAQMYALPPRPIFQTSAPLWLLSLVDIRYTWWFAKSDWSVPDAANSWATLLATVSGFVPGGVTFEQAVPAAYLNAPISLTSHFEYLPLVIDAIAFSTGTRLVMPLGGTGGVLRNATRAKAVNDAQITATAQGIGVKGGGLLRFDPRNFQNDLGALLPGSVTVSFPQQNFGLAQTTPASVDVTLASLLLPELVGVRGNGLVQVIHSSACYRAPSLAPALDAGNAAEITALAQQIARDFYRWRLPRVETRLNGIVAWNPDGFSEIEWSHHVGGEVWTAIRRPPWNAEAMELVHCGTPGNSAGGNSNRHGGTGQSLFGRPIAFDQAVSLLGRLNLQEAAVNVAGTVNDLSIPDCQLLRVNASASPVLTGITNPGSDMALWLVNTGGVDLILKFQNGGSLGQNRFLTPNGVDFTVYSGAGCMVVYESGNTSWRVVEGPNTKGIQDINFFRHTGTATMTLNYSGGNITGLTGFTNAALVDTMQGLCFVNPRTLVLDRLKIWCDTGYDNSKVRLAIYASTSQTNLWPSVLVVDSGDLVSNAAASGSYLSDTINVTLAAGTLYWLFLNAKDDGTTEKNLPIFGATNDAFLYNVLGASDTSWAQYYGINFGQAYGAFPDPFPGADVTKLANGIFCLPVVHVASAS